VEFIKADVFAAGEFDRLKRSPPSKSHKPKRQCRSARMYHNNYIGN